jgi:hypothetical protein
MFHNFPLLKWQLFWLTPQLTHPSPPKKPSTWCGMSQKAFSISCPATATAMACLPKETIVMQAILGENHGLLYMFKHWW